MDPIVQIARRVTAAPRNGNPREAGMSASAWLSSGGPVRLDADGINLAGQDRSGRGSAVLARAALALAPVSVGKVRHLQLAPVTVPAIPVTLIGAALDPVVGLHQAGPWLAAATRALRAGRDSGKDSGWRLALG
jgi:hypothetical protein